MPNHRRSVQIILFCFALAALLLGNGCAMAPGRDDTVTANGPPNQSNPFLRAAKSAFYDYGTWPLLLGAALFGVSDYDTEVADYAMEHRPLFSTNDSAERTTDTLRRLSYVFTYGTALAVDEGWRNKGERVLTESTALFTTRLVTKQMNLQVDREYPNGSGNDSFGSHHAASPFAAAALTRRNITNIDMPRWSAISINASAYTAATVSAWGRIEMGLHYPSDQLASAAVGNFVAIFFHDAFLSQKTMVDLSLLPGGGYLALHVPF
ncbi:phosphatase PAP2 family protein [Thiohalomonas denitrificans]|uniref:phosphatase PAP2 family protein n=1 Tax=Thiohalomonas denitrificans TaxID=415747 RepID=UPI0026E98D36|nr:phosphatase PAP2 family protein [Thiohalomonas denitrificans]